MNLVTSPVVYGLGAALLVSLGWGGWQLIRVHSERTAHAETKARHAKVLLGLADMTAKTAVAVNAREREIRNMLDSSNTAREEGIANAVIEQQRVVADVRGESLRLRQQWRGCQAALAGTTDAGASGSVNDAAELRATGSGDLVRVGLDADIQVAGLQEYARACQALTAPIDIH